MALHVAIYPVLKGLGYALRNWSGLAAFTGLIVATGFSVNGMMRQAGETALSLWPLIALFFLFLLTREVIRGYFKAKENANTLGDR